MSEQVTTHDGNSGAGKSQITVRFAPGIRLPPNVVALLQKAFQEHEFIFVTQEYRSGYSGALVLLVSVGAGRAPLVVKLAHPHDLHREYEAYQTYVRQIAPQNIAHLQGEPLLSDDGQLGLIEYTFAGGESHLPTTSLQTYYEKHGAEAVAAVLSRVFRAFGRHWWGDNRANTCVFGEHYDRLLPVHVQVGPRAPDSQEVTVISAGAVDIMDLRKLVVGQPVQIVGFEVAKVQARGHSMTLTASPPSGQASAILRIRMETPEPLPYRAGDKVETLDAVVVALRFNLLADAAVASLPGFDPTRPEIVAQDQTISKLHLPNPLISLDQCLDRVIETKMSVIHGDLNLQNVLVDEPTGFAWLIDFAETRLGPTLLDLQRLEVQILTKLLPPALAQVNLPDSTVVQMIELLHADPPPLAPSKPELLQPYTMLVTVRRLSRQYLMDDFNWDEYYYGLHVALVGALKYTELDNDARRVALLAAAAVGQQVGRPLAKTPPGMSAQMAAVEAAPSPSAPEPVGAPHQPARAAEQASSTPAHHPASAPPSGPRAALPTAKAVVAPADGKGAAKAANVPSGRSRNPLVGIGIAAVSVLLILLMAWWFATSLPDAQEAINEGAAGQQSAAVISATSTLALPATPTVVQGNEQNPPVSAGDGISQIAGASGADTPAVAQITTEPAQSATETPPHATRTTTATVMAAIPLAPSPTPAVEPTRPGPTLQTATVTPDITAKPSTSATSTPEDITPASAAQVTARSQVNIRSGPGTDYPVIASLRTGETALVTGRNGDGTGLWLQIARSDGDGPVGWVTSNPDLVEATNIAGVATVTVPTPQAVAQRTLDGAIYYSATDANNRGNIYRIALGDELQVERVVEDADQPALSPVAQRLAYRSLDGSTLGISALNEIGGNRVRVSNAPEDSIPAWSRDGERVAFGSVRAGDRKPRLYLAPADGSLDAQVLGFGSEPDWNPSGDRLVYKGCNTYGEACGLWLMSLDGAQQPLTSVASDSRPRWSPGGSNAVFMSRERDDNWEIYAVDVNSAEVQRLTNNTANDGLPVVSPDGRWVAFFSDRGGQWGIWAMPITGEPAQQIVSIPDPLPNWLEQGIDWGE